MTSELTIYTLEVNNHKKCAYAGSKIVRSQLRLVIASGARRASMSETGAFGGLSALDRSLGHAFYYQWTACPGSPLHCR